MKFEQFQNRYYEQFALLDCLSLNIPGTNFYAR